MLLRAIAIALLIATAMAAKQQSPPQRQYFIPTSQVVRVAWMAARDEGFDPSVPGTYLDELRTADRKEPYSGYTSIGLYRGGHIVRAYSIRIATGDIVDATSCTLFRYPDLIRFKKTLVKGFGTTEVSADQIASEVGCERLGVLPAKATDRKSR